MAKVAPYYSVNEIKKPPKNVFTTTTMLADLVVTYRKMNVDPVQVATGSAKTATTWAHGEMLYENRNSSTFST